MKISAKLTAAMHNFVKAMSGATAIECVLIAAPVSVASQGNGS